MKKRREFLESAGLGSAALMAAMAMMARDARAETLPVLPAEKPRHHIRFAVCGMSHDHVHGMIGAVQRGGGELVAYWGAEPDKLALFRQLLQADVERTECLAKGGGKCVYRIKVSGE